MNSIDPSEKMAKTKFKFQKGPYFERPMSPNKIDAAIKNYKTVMLPLLRLNRRRGQRKTTTVISSESISSNSSMLGSSGIFKLNSHY